ncbi:SDR family NAD(P)-dependent oxidoreductase [Streptomyces qinzhouensis]|uniref:SDR family oxidoreductase n=1 Tax=Streptomyces qinzhouensis TaxID=2599401 RepID=A0A5B8ISE7_9ACTN|nr:SDR family NAD(P)-dependent oxidoreductase [Streptomyces qinzhouensis]QDY75229.1 SDR family oxidoreductase [Streptomyces qinzhouensis]QDY80569.1 SDR family oxidoreductase [Streptomyces qinzhouensis]
MTAPAQARPLSAPRPERPVALVTGASGGFGAAVAVELDRLGCRVALHYNRAEDGAREVGMRLTNDSVVVQADVSSWESVTALYRRVAEELGEVDVLVSNAAVRKDALMMSQSPEVWGEVIETNLMGTFHVCRAVLPSMVKRRWGRIINVVSPSALVATSGQTAYAASKAGVIGLTRTLAVECGRRGVTVNALSPGFMETRMTANASEKFRQSLAAKLPVPRLTTPEEVAPAIGVFLDNDYLTGQILSVDGGISLT